MLDRPAKEILKSQNFIHLSLLNFFILMHRTLVLLLALLCPLLLLQPAVQAQTGTVATTKPKASVSTKAAVKTSSKSTTNLQSKTAAPPAKTVSKAANAVKTAPKNTAAKASTNLNKQTSSPAGTPIAVKKRSATSAKQAKTNRNSRSRTRTVAAAAAANPIGSAVLDIDKQISARSAMILDAASGETIFAKMPDNPRQPASTIKIVTAMIAIESLQNDDIVEVSRHAAEMPSSKIYLQTDKTYRADDLISAVLLESANDAAVALGEKIAGSEEKFANLMTISARMWGAQSTECRTASGLTAVGQQSTARDLANLFRFAMQHEPFAARMKEKYIRTSYGKNLRNHNKALWKIDGAVGGKTGYTVAARQTYVGMFSREGRSIVVSIMGSESMWADLAKLVDYGFRKLPAETTAGNNS